jgi:hypothetical protein
METGKREMYPVIENAVRDAAKRHGLTLDEFSSVVWEGIGDTIKQTGELYGVKHAAGKIPESAGGFNYLIPRLVEEKAQRLGVPLDEFVRRLRAGDAELLGVLAATPALAAVWQAWARSQPPTEPTR